MNQKNIVSILLVACVFASTQLSALQSFSDFFSNQKSESFIKQLPNQSYDFETIKKAYITKIENPYNEINEQYGNAITLQYETEFTNLWKEIIESALLDNKREEEKLDSMFESLTQLISYLREQTSIPTEKLVQFIEYVISMRMSIPLLEVTMEHEELQGENMDACARDAFQHMSFLIEKKLSTIITDLFLK